MTRPLALALIIVSAGCAPTARQQETQWYSCVLTKAPDFLPIPGIACECSETQMRCWDLEEKSP
jgi:hypothetical protein